MDYHDELDNEQSDFSDTSASVETKSVGLGWRVIVVAVALVVIAFLAYPWIQARLSDSPPNDDTTTSSEDQTNIAAPQATVQANPDSADAQFELGNSYVQSGELDKALAAYQKVIELDPDYQAAYANMGVVYYQRQQLDLAALQYQKALELDPNDADVAYNLGALYIQQALQNGNQPDNDLLETAISQLNQALELNPDLAEPHFSLGVAYLALNRTEEAVQAFETFLARDSGQDPRAKQEAERYLQTLRGQ